MPTDRVARPALMAAVLLGLAACSSQPGSSAPTNTGSAGTTTASGSATAGTTTASGSATAGPIQVTATDTACTLSATTAPAGTITFRVKNTGTKVNEFYVYGPGDRVLAEVENVAPGLSRELKVELPQPGTFQTACKPGMSGEGIRAAFTVTGGTAAGKTDEKVAQAITAYQAFVAQQADQLRTETAEFVSAVKAGDVAKAKSRYSHARAPWERIEPVAESFGDLDPKIDGRADVVEEGLAFTGYHRLEKDLWVDGLRPDSSAIADQLLTDVTTIGDRAKGVHFTGLDIANGAKGLLDEVARTKVTGEEERYSHTDLADMKANLEGVQAALDALRPVVTERQPALMTELDSAFTGVNKLLDSHRAGDDDYTALTDVSAGDVKALSVALDALAEQTAQVPGVVDQT